MNAEVHWPLTQKIIGILGVAPLATADMMRRLAQRTVRKDWEHPRVIVDSNPKIPSRGRYLELGETDPVPFLRDGINDLAKAGADIVVVPCNTAHILYERFTRGVDVYVPSIIEVTADACEKAAAGKTVLPLASRGVVRHGLYQAALDKRGIRYAPCSDQDFISSCIEAVKEGNCIETWTDRFNAYIERMAAKGIKTVITGCTELSCLADEERMNKAGVDLIDSNQALADHCHGFANSA